MSSLEQAFESFSLNEEKHGKRSKVKKILDHEENKGTYTFLVKFQDGTTSWVDDRNCSCEHTIREYFDEQKIEVNTLYLVCRVSSKAQAGPLNLSLDEQLRLLLTQTKPYKNYRIKICQISASAYAKTPDEIMNISEEARDGDVVMVYRVDRITRDIFGFLHVLEDMNKRGVSFFAYEEGLWYEDNKTRIAQLMLNGTVESEGISRRVKMALAAKRLRGDYIGGVKYGYKTTRTSTGVVKLVENEAEQRIVKLILRCKTLADVHKTVDKLNDSGIKKRGRAWTVAMAKSIWSKK